jgi:hypothetical protein
VDERSAEGETGRSVGSVSALPRLISQSVEPDARRLFENKAWSSECLFVLGEQGGAVMTAVLNEIRDLRESIRRIEARLESAEAPVINLREGVPADVARQEIIAAFKEAGDSAIFYDDLSDTLRLPIRQVIEICEALMSEGIIGEKQSP